MECPVCENKDITAFATQCSVCGTDVVAFHLLDDLEEQTVSTLKENVSLEGELAAMERVRRAEKHHSRKCLNRMYWFLFLLPIMFFWCGKKNVIGTTDNKNKKQMEELEAKNASLEDEIKELKSQLSKPVPTVKKEVTHIIKKGDSLSELAKLYLNDVSEWEKIYQLNPSIRDEKLLIPGDTIVIKLR